MNKPHITVCPGDEDPLQGKRYAGVAQFRCAWLMGKRHDGPWVVVEYPPGPKESEDGCAKDEETP